MLPVFDLLSSFYVSLLQDVGLWTVLVVLTIVAGTSLHNFQGCEGWREIKVS